MDSSRPGGSPPAPPRPGALAPGGTLRRAAGPPSALRRPLRGSTTRLALAVLALNLADALFTLRHVARGAEELNPVMAHLLELGPLPFVLGKHALASIGLAGLALCERHRAARLALRGVLFPLFVAVVVYQVALLFVL